MKFAKLGGGHTFYGSTWLVLHEDCMESARRVDMESLHFLVRYDVTTRQLKNAKLKYALSLKNNVTHYQRVSIASYANRWYSQRRNVRPSVRPSVTLRYYIKTKKASVMISSPSESLNILVSRNIWFITKFDRGHPEQGRLLRLGWVQTGDFGNFSTNKPSYFRNGAR